MRSRKRRCSQPRHRICVAGAEPLPQRTCHERKQHDGRNRLVTRTWQQRDRGEPVCDAGEPGIVPQPRQRKKQRETDQHRKPQAAAPRTQRRRRDESQYSQPTDIEQAVHPAEMDEVAGDQPPDFTGCDGGTLVAQRIRDRGPAGLQRKHQQSDREKARMHSPAQPPRRMATCQDAQARHVRRRTKATTPAPSASAIHGSTAPAPESGALPEPPPAATSPSGAVPPSAGCVWSARSTRTGS